jgi:glycine cleavage system H protein
MEFPEELKYTKTHEWIRIENNIVTCGITDYAQSELSDIVYVELRPVGTEVKKGMPFGSIEAVKAVSDLYAPVSGKIIEINTALSESPELINESPYEKGWMVKIEVSASEELDMFLSALEYKELIK